MAELRFVVDTNVVVSAAMLPGSVPRQAFDLVIERGQLLLSPPILGELNDVLRRKRLDKYVSEEKRLLFLAALVRAAVLIETTTSVTECRDPKDDKFS